MAGTGWTRGQLLLAFWFYCQTPFGQLHSRNPKVIDLAARIGRTPGAVAMKCVNFASLDPAIRASGRTGLGNASAADRGIWDEFHADWEGLALEADAALHDAGPTMQTDARVSISDGAPPDYTGHTRPAVVQQRIGQRFFRNAVLSSYRGRCCISGTSEPRLLVASHIAAWQDDPANRLNPSNGLCLSAIHDRAFDSYLFTLDDDLRIVLSDRLRASRDDFLREVFWAKEGQPIAVPEKFAPDPALIAAHRARTFAAHLPPDA